MILQLLILIIMMPGAVFSASETRDRFLIPSSGMNILKEPSAKAAVVKRAESDNNVFILEWTGKKERRTVDGVTFTGEWVKVRLGYDTGYVLNQSERPLQIMRAVDPETRMVTASVLNLRTEPSIKSAVAGKLKRGDVVWIAEQEGFVDTVNGTPGVWVSLEVGGNQRYAFSPYLGALPVYNPEKDRDSYAGVVQYRKEHPQIVVVKNVDELETVTVLLENGKVLRFAPSGEGEGCTATAYIGMIPSCNAAVLQHVIWEGWGGLRLVELAAGKVICKPVGFPLVSPRGDRFVSSIVFGEMENDTTYGGDSGLEIWHIQDGKPRKVLTRKKRGYVNLRWIDDDTISAEKLFAQGTDDIAQWPEYDQTAVVKQAILFRFAGGVWKEEVVVDQ